MRGGGIWVPRAGPAKDSSPRLPVNPLGLWLCGCRAKAWPAQWAGVNGCAPKPVLGCSLACYARRLCGSLGPTQSHAWQSTARRTRWRRLDAPPRPQLAAALRAKAQPWFGTAPSPLGLWAPFGSPEAEWEGPPCAGLNWHRRSVAPAGLGRGARAKQYAVSRPAGQCQPPTCYAVGARREGLHLRLILRTFATRGASQWHCAPAGQGTRPALGPGVACQRFRRNAVLSRRDHQMARLPSCRPPSAQPFTARGPRAFAGHGQLVRQARRRRADPKPALL